METVRLLILFVINGCFGQNVSEYYFWKYGRNNHNVNDLDQMETDVVFENFYVCAMECAKVRIFFKKNMTPPHLVIF